MKETALMEWVNTESGGAERKARQIMEERILRILKLQGNSPEEIAHVFAMAIAEYVLEGICGNVYRKEVQ